MSFEIVATFPAGDDLDEMFRKSELIEAAAKPFESLYAGTGACKYMSDAREIWFAAKTMDDAIALRANLLATGIEGLIVIIQEAMPKQKADG